MDICKLKIAKISSGASAQIIADYFPKHQPFAKQDFSNFKEASLHKGALCLYASTLITQIHETRTEDITLESNQREIDIENHLKNYGKFTHLTNQQIQEKAHEMVIRDVRNCFAHGNFKIGYDFNKMELFFILSPQRKDISINTPIIISAQSLIHANKSFVAEIGFRLLDSQEEIQDELENNLSQLLKTIMLPTEMLKMMNDYLGNIKSIFKAPINEKKCLLIQYILEASQMVYQQDDYYHIFGKDSNIFDRISLIRNSIAHNNFDFADLSRNVNYTDRNRALNETLQKSTISLITAREQKDVILKIFEKGHSREAVQDLIDKLKECFDAIFGGDDESLKFDDNEL